MDDDLSAIYFFKNSNKKVHFILDSQDVIAKALSLVRTL